MGEIALIRTIIGMIHVRKLISEQRTFYVIRDKKGHKMKVYKAHIVYIYYKEDDNESNDNYDADATYG